MHGRVTWIASLAVLAGVVGSSSPAEAQANLGGATRVTFSGNVIDLTNPNGFMLAGVSRIAEGGAEFGGDLAVSFNSNGASGFGFFRGGYNFIGESLTVPFVTGGVGVPLGGGGGGSYPYQAGGGIKRFISETASFDVAGNYQGMLNSFGAAGTLSVQFGMSLYFGN